MRARIDVSEIEAETKIRAKYLRALENEEWDLLPGPTFVKSFLRTYGNALGLDGKALVEEYKLSHERPSEGDMQPIVAGPGRSGRRAPSPAKGPSRGYFIALAGVGLLIVLLLVGLLSGGGSSKQDAGTTSAGSTTRTTGNGHRHARHAATTTPGSAARSDVVALSLQPTATVYVCLLGEGGRKLIPGATLEAGTTEPTFHSRRFTLTLGNNSVKLTINGIPRVVPPSSRAIGYSITKAGRRTLAAAQQPTCR